jgi:hypothetical protein
LGKLFGERPEIPAQLAEALNRASNSIYALRALRGTSLQKTTPAACQKPDEASLAFDA